MTSIKLKFLEDKVLKDGTHPIAIQIIHDRKKKLFHLGHSLKNTEWDKKNNTPNTKSPNYRLLRGRIKTAINDLEAIILELENIKVPFNITDIEAKFKPERTQDSSAKHLIHSLKR